VKAQIISPDGREILLYHVCSGDSCVLTTSCLLGDNNYPAEGYTETEVSAFAIPANIFHRCLEQSTFFREFVFRNFSQRLADVIKRMESISFGSIDQKLASALLASGETTLRKTHNELALELGSAREVVSRHLKRFESYGWLTLSRGSIQNIRGCCRFTRVTK
jgi:CRP/FNR family transcriptional regulator